ncbi:MAG: beta-N-acetylhexosaminidase [Pseudomonadota bacterium]
MRRALIIGVSGLSLTAEEKEFISSVLPAGLILFARNISGREQLKNLIHDYRDHVGDKKAPVLVDQEGGKVQRLRPPLAPNYPNAQIMGEIYQRDTKKGIRAAWLNARLIGDDLHSFGFNVDCDPVLDLKISGAHDIIGTRAYGETVESIVALAQAKIEGLLAAGVLPVIKHIPGHGRARADSHLELPVVKTSHAELSKTDFAPFKALKTAPFAMTAHVVYADIDKDNPATTSKTMIEDVIRGEIGYEGALMSDDLGMKALSGSFADRAAKSLEAGCDLILHCSGAMDEMRDIESVVPRLSGQALLRYEAALAQLHVPQPFNRDEAEAELKSLLAEANAEASFETLVA